MTANAETTTAVSGEIVIKRRYDDAQLRSIESFADVINLAGTGILDIAQSELSTGFSVLKNKDALVGVKFVIIDWGFTMGDQGEFVSVLVITEKNEKVIINDGSTGICAQLRKLPNNGQPIGVSRGLRKSDYVRKDEAGNPLLNPKTGQPERATTFYLDTSAD